MLCAARACGNKFVLPTTHQMILSFVSGHFEKNAEVWWSCQGLWCGHSSILMELEIYYH